MSKEEKMGKNESGLGVYFSKRASGIVVIVHLVLFYVSRIFMLKQRETQLMLIISSKIYPSVVYW